MLVYQCLKRGVEIVWSVNLACDKVECERARCDLRVSPVDSIGLITGIHQHADVPRARYHLKCEFYLLSGDAVRYDQYAGRLGAWPLMAPPQTETNGNGRYNSDEWD